MEVDLETWEWYTHKFKCVLFTITVSIIVFIPSKYRIQYIWMFILRFRIPTNNCTICALSTWWLVHFIVRREIIHLASSELWRVWSLLRRRWVECSPYLHPKGDRSFGPRSCNDYRNAEFRVVTVIEFPGIEMPRHSMVRIFAEFRWRKL